MADDREVLLKVENLKQYFKMGNGWLKAVDDVSFDIKKGEVFGLVGESGCGKTTTGRSIIKLYNITGGDVYFKGQRISAGTQDSKENVENARKETERLIAELKAKSEREAKAAPDKASEITKKYNKLMEEANNKLADYIDNQKTRLKTAKADAKNCSKLYTERRVAEAKAKYKDKLDKLNKDMERNGASSDKLKRELEETNKLMKEEIKVASKERIMTKIQMIFQDPIASLNPRMTVREIIAEGLRIRGIKNEKYIEQKVYEVLELVGLVSEHAERYPHEFSGGQRQRIGIARAVIMEPELIIADEPISALDVSIQAQVINLLNDLREKMGLTIMFVAHDLSVVKYFSDRIGVMYFGKMVELASSDELFANPCHPYTKSLLSAIPLPDPHYEKKRKRITYNPSIAHNYTTDMPTLREISPGHFVYCNLEEFDKYQQEIANA